MHKCSGVGLILGLVLLVTTIWPNILGNVANFWIAVVIGALLVLHTIFHQKCCIMGDGKMDNGMGMMPKKRSKKRR